MNELIKRQREKNNISFRELSKKTNISVGCLHNYESGKTSPSLYNFCKIAKILGISLHITTLDEVLSVN